MIAYAAICDAFRSLGWTQKQINRVRDLDFDLELKVYPHGVSHRARCNATNTTIHCQETMPGYGRWVLTKGYEATTFFRFNDLIKQIKPVKL